MKNFNFDNMKNFTVSDEWADRVLSTASTIQPSKKPNVTVITTCLSLVFVCILGVIGFNFTKNTPKTLPMDVLKETQNETLSNLVEETEKPTTQNETVKESTEHQTVSASTVKPTQMEEITPTQITPQPTVTPTQPQTQPTPEPTEPVLPSEGETTEPTDNGTQNPSGSNGDCIVSFSPSYLVGSGKIYCRIKDDNLKSVGDTNLFSDQHLASFYSGFGSNYYYLYSPENAGLVLEPGTYNYYFYNEHGIPICQVVVEIN